MIAVSILWRRWWPTFVVLLIIVVSWLIGDGFRAEERVSALIVDLRAPYDRKDVDQDISSYLPFSGDVIFVVAPGEGQLCAEFDRRDPDGLVTANGYCPLPALKHTTVVRAGPPTEEGRADVARGFAKTLLRSNGRVSEAGRAEGSFVWTAALATGVLLFAGAAAVWSLATPRKRRAAPAATGITWQLPHISLGGSVPDHYGTSLPETGTAEPTTKPVPPPAPPHQPPGDQQPSVRDAPPAPVPWAPPTPSHVVLEPVDSTTSPELARIVREADGRAVARTHVDADGGYVAIGDVVVWGASPADGVLPGEPVGVECTGDTAVPLTIFPASSSPAPEQRYHR